MRSQLYVAFDLGYISQAEFDEMVIQCKKISAMIYKLIQSLKSSKFKSLKYKKEEKEDLWEKFLRENHPELYKQLTKYDSP